MRTSLRFALVGVGLASAAGCGVFDNPTPKDVSLRLSGNAAVEIILSRQFVAGVDESSGTHVQILSADTLHRTLPVDTVIDIAVEQRFFVQVTPEGVDKASIAARVRVDDRTVVDDSGDVPASDPWRYVYVFNQRITQIVDVKF